MMEYRRSYIASTTAMLCIVPPVGRRAVHNALVMTKHRIVRFYSPPTFRCPPTHPILHLPRRQLFPGLFHICA